MAIASGFVCFAVVSPGFVRDDFTSKKLEAVYALWEQWNDGPQSPAPKKLSKPTKTDVPLPENDITAGIAGDR
ncbi:hypothetical protein AAVH_24956 [Aphelenchoides avenae]|nr:hypothetical protein AAVH_24956 [Aphelenchus avenae]